MIGNKKLILFHEALNAWKGFDPSNRLIRLDAMKDMVCCVPLVIASGRFLMKLKLFLRDFWICPFDGANFFDIFVMIVDDDNVISQGILDSLHPMGMNNTGSDTVLRRRIIDKTEFKDSGSHHLVVFIGFFFMGNCDFRHVVMTSWIAARSRRGVMVLRNGKVRHGRGRWIRRATHVTRRDF